MSIYPPTVILRCFIVKIWLRLDSNRALHDYLAMDYYPYNKQKDIESMWIKHSS